MLIINTYSTFKSLMSISFYLSVIYLRYKVHNVFLSLFTSVILTLQPTLYRPTCLHSDSDDIRHVVLLLGLDWADRVVLWVCGEHFQLDGSMRLDSQVHQGPLLLYYSAYKGVGGWGGETC